VHLCPSGSARLHAILFDSNPVLCALVRLRHRGSVPMFMHTRYSRDHPTDALGVAHARNVQVRSDPTR